MAICGKFRGKVVENRDPQQMGRVRVQVPEVQGGIEEWALPCLPYAGDHVGFFAAPPIDANVWVEFEGGDVNFPIWTGCFWDSGEAPAAVGTPEKKIFVIPGVNMTLDDTPGDASLTLEVATSGVEIRLSNRGVLLKHDSATIELIEHAVSINGEALVVS